MTHLTDPVSYCPCDHCRHQKTCTHECQHFRLYVVTGSPDQRKKQLAEIVDYIHGSLGVITDVEPERLRGALEMANRLVRLPLKLANDNEVADELNKQVMEDLIGISTSLVRNYLTE